MRHQPGEGPDCSQVGEPGGVAEPTSDLGCADHAHAGSRADDPIGVDLLVERGDPLVQGLDLVADR